MDIPRFPRWKTPEMRPQHSKAPKLQDSKHYNIPHFGIGMYSTIQHSKIEQVRKLWTMNSKVPRFQKSKAPTFLCLTKSSQVPNSREPVFQKWNLGTLQFPVLKMQFGNSGILEVWNGGSLECAAKYSSFIERQITKNQHD